MAEVIPYKQIADRIEFLRSRNKDLKVVATNGCFDILHIGHIRSLQKAKSLGNILVVGVNGDSSVKKNKGNNRPLNNESYRTEMLASLSCVDLVTIFPEKTAENFLEIVKPDIYVKSDEYDLDNIPESRVIKKLGGKLVKVPTIPGYSTTSIIEKLKNL